MNWKTIEKTLDHPVTKALINIAMALLTEALTPAPPPKSRRKSGKAVRRQ